MLTFILRQSHQRSFMISLHLHTSSVQLMVGLVISSRCDKLTQVILEHLTVSTQHTVISLRPWHQSHSSALYVQNFAGASEASKAQFAQDCGAPWPCANSQCPNGHNHDGCPTGVRFVFFQHTKSESSFCTFCDEMRRLHFTGWSPAGGGVCKRVRPAAQAANLPIGSRE